jgi:hypothetical protein
MKYKSIAILIFCASVAPTILAQYDFEFFARRIAQSFGSRSYSVQLVL